MGGTASSFARLSSYSVDQGSCYDSRTDEVAKTLLFTECTTELDLKCITGLLRCMSPSFRLHVTMPQFTNMEKVVDMTVIKHLNKELFFHAMDAGDDSAVEETINNITKMERSLDVVVFSFDARVTSCFESSTMEETISAFSRNLFSHIRVVQKVIPIMKKQRRGDIIVLSNVAGLQGLPNHTIYCAARFGVEGLFESLAAECAAHNIRVTILETAIQKELDMASLDLMVDRRLYAGLSHESGMKNAIENKLTENGLKKKTKPEKVVDAIHSIISSYHYITMRRYLNKSALNLAKSRFVDSKGLRQLNEIMKFFLNTELDYGKDTGRPMHGILRRTKTF